MAPLSPAASMWTSVKIPDILVTLPRRPSNKPFTMRLAILGGMLLLFLLSSASYIPDSYSRLRRAATNSFLEKAKSPALTQLPQNKAVVEVCDAQNNPHNYFIYCSGKLLDAVMEYRLFNDSKTFVDMPMKYDAREVEKAFEKQFPMAVAEIPLDKLRQFVNENFLSENTELLK